MSADPTINKEIEALFEAHMDITGGYDIYDTPKLQEAISALLQREVRQAEIKFIKDILAKAGEERYGVSDTVSTYLKDRIASLSKPTEDK